MVSIDTQAGVVQYAPPALVVGDAAARIAGLTINEWFYIVAILSMLISTIVTNYIAIRKAQRKETQKDE